jgi:hypothetical protein
MLPWRSQRERYETRDLLQRLAATEDGGVVPPDYIADRLATQRLADERRRAFWTYFTYGFAASCIGGVIVVVTMQFMSSGQVVPRARLAPRSHTG